MNYLINPDIPHGDLALMTFPSFRWLLDDDKVPDALCVTRVVAIDSKGELIGLLLGTEDSASEPGNVFILRSLFVGKAYRRQGIGSNLMRQAVGHLKSGKSDRMIVNYSDGKECIEWFELILKSTGWDRPERKMVLIKCDFSEITSKQPVWYRGGNRLDSTQEIVQWSEVSEDARAELRQSQKTEKWVPNDLMPEEYEYLGPFEETTSLAFLQNGKIAGWLLTHEVDSKLLRFTCGYVRSELQRRGRLFSMLRIAIDNMAIRGFQEGIWTSPVKHELMYRFVKKRMAPYAVYCRHTNESKLDF